VSRSTKVFFAEPRVHAFVYEPTTGEARKLSVDFYKYINELRSVYDLYKLEPEAVITESDPEVIKSLLDSK
jgi:hypothetical protein